jgi:peptidoglycan/xylan/chitin deacetylase (PgdA/CDA1 family)
VRPDEERTARLLLGGSGDPQLMKEPAVRRAVRGTRVPPVPLRIAHALALKAGLLSWERSVVEPYTRARVAALGDSARGAPRVLVRVDEFPHARAWDPGGEYGVGRFQRFHEVLAAEGVPYLLAVCARVSRDYLDPSAGERRPLDSQEVTLLGRLRDEGVSFAVHGYDHRTRHSSPRRHSELGGLAPEAVAALLDRAREELRDVDVETRVFVPPFNRFDGGQYSTLAKRFDVVCGGPETVRVLGFKRTPVWLEGAVYLPSYPPLYGRASDVLPAVERLVERDTGLWAPVTLHWSWEAQDDFAALRRLAALLSDCAVPWSGFLEAVASSRTASPGRP